MREEIVVKKLTLLDYDKLAFESKRYWVALWFMSMNFNPNRRKICVDRFGRFWDAVKDWVTNCELDIYYLVEFAKLIKFLEGLDESISGKLALIKEEIQTQVQDRGLTEIFHENNLCWWNSSTKPSEVSKYPKSLNNES